MYSQRRASVLYSRRLELGEIVYEPIRRGKELIHGISFWRKKELASRTCPTAMTDDPRATATSLTTAARTSKNEQRLEGLFHRWLVPAGRDFGKSSRDEDVGPSGALSGISRDEFIHREFFSVNAHSSRAVMISRERRFSGSSGPFIFESASPRAQTIPRDAFMRDRPRECRLGRFRCPLPSEQGDIVSSAQSNPPENDTLPRRPSVNYFHQPEI